jgi:hypothetical protein
LGRETIAFPRTGTRPLALMFVSGTRLPHATSVQPEMTMNSLRHWMDSIEQAAVDDYGYRSDEAVKFTGDVFNDDAEDQFETEEPDFADIE